MRFPAREQTRGTLEACAGLRTVRRTNTQQGSGPLTSIDWDRHRNPVELLDREWLVTNGLGGYASGSLAGAATRKYHGLFVPNLTAPKGRHVLISRCDELVLIDGQTYPISDVEFGDGRLTGEAHRWLRQFRLDHGMASWIFEFGNVVLERAIVMAHLQNTACIRYRVLEGPSVELRIRPFICFRRHDQPPSTRRDGAFALTVEQGRHEFRLVGNPITLRMAVQPGPTVFTTEEEEHVDWVYRIDRNRGDSARERVFSPGWFNATAHADRPACILASTHGWERLDIDASELFAAERRRLDDLVSLSGVRDDDAMAKQLVRAADQFIVLPGSRMDESATAQAHGSELRSIYAGYHWFGDWGRDTMISLEGLTLCTRRYREAAAILRTFASYVRDGLLPNLFPEGERQALYHTVDATLWFFHSIARYVETTSDRSVLEDLFPTLQSIVRHHIDGTRYGIHMDPRDGLIAAAADGYQLTWMDAKVDGWVVTPRRGKPVEIQALWYNALRHMAHWSRELGSQGPDYDHLASRVRNSFNRRFWNNGALFDVIDGPDGDDAAIRPNQVFAVALPHAVLDSSRWEHVIGIVRDRLLTPFGLRTLDPGHPDYKSRYFGDLLARDAAYHQGTVWPWLIGPFVDAWLRIHPDRARARELLSAFVPHLSDAGVGSISEIFDAEYPHVPGGCMAQAWSVAEVLRVWLKTQPHDSR